MPVDPDSPVVPGNPGYGESSLSLWERAKSAFSTALTATFQLFSDPVGSLGAVADVQSGGAITGNDPDTGMPKDPSKNPLSWLTDVLHYAFIGALVIVAVLLLVVVLDVLSFLPRKRDA